MHDDLRTLLQDFLVDLCAVDTEDSEERAERLGGLLLHKGYEITRFGNKINMVKVCPDKACDDDMILSEKQIGELLSCQDDKLEKIKCNNCGRIHKVPCPKTNFNYCSACGTKFEKEPERNPWLWKGCLCEIWKNDYHDRMSGFFSKIENGKKLFVQNYYTVGLDSEKVPGAFFGFFENYRITGTPLDFVHWDIEKIMINDDGDFHFLYTGGRSLNSLWLPWRNCPEHLKGKTLPIPDWARNE